MRSAALALLVAVSALACRTGDRLWRVSPFEGSAASDRVNLWPLAYHSGDETSVLWPLFDVDQRGFALRPLVAKDDSAYSILFPLAAFDAESGEGWIGPFYRFGEHAGLFPIAHLGQTSYVGPWWWTEDSSGLFPIMRFDGLSYVGPVWWSEGEGMKAGLFPVAGFGSLSYVGPAWWTSDGDSYGLFPLFGKDFLGEGIDHVGPVWWRPEAEGLDGGLAPLLWYGDHGDSLGVFPLYWHDLDERSRSRYFLAGLGHTSSAGEREEDWLAPLYYHRAGPATSDTVLFPFFWKRVRGDSADVYTLLGNRSVDPDSRALNLYPLWWSNESAASSWRMLFPLFYYEREGDARTLITPLGGRGWSAAGGDDFVNVLGPLYHHSASASRDEERTAFLWPLFERHRKGDVVTTRMAGLYAHEASSAGAESSFAFGLGHAERTASGSSHRLWPLYSWSDDADLPGPMYGLTLYGWRHHGDTTEQRLFPLFSSERGPASSRWDALLGLVHHDRAGAETTRSERWWAWPLVSHSTGERGPSLTDVTSLVGSARWDGGTHFQLGCSLLYSASTEQRPDTERRDARALLLFTHEEERFVGAHVPTAGAAQVQNRIAHESRGFLFDAFVSERATYHLWDEGVLSDAEARVLRAYAAASGQEGPPDREAARAVLTAHGVPVEGKDPIELRSAVEEFAAAHTRTVERRHVRLPLVWDYERSEHELDWSGPLGLVHYDRDPRRSRFSLLYYGYRSETEGARTSRDIFPFVTWDTGPDERHMSFLWRFLDYERKGERRGGHVLFIPWGDV